MAAAVGLHPHQHLVVLVFWFVFCFAVLTSVQWYLVMVPSLRVDL